MLTDVLRELGVVSILAVPLLVSLAVFVDIAHWDSWVWAFAGRSRIVWLCLVAFGVLSVVGGLLICGWYLLRIRPQLRRIAGGQVTDTGSLVDDA